jgi:hypothetical protein
MRKLFTRFLGRLISGTKPPEVDQPSGKQRIPDVTKRDVERIVHRDFPREYHGEVIELLQTYEREAASRASARVQVAALKLSKGNTQKLRIHLAAAQRDYRDVLVAAEYPEYGRRVGLRSRNLGSKEVQAIIDRDWKQYEEWLKE